MYWVKYFENETKEYASQSDINEGKASWSNGRLEDMIAAEVGFGKYTASICVSKKTEWHQFDRMIVPVGIGAHRPKKVATTIQAQIKIDHDGGYIIETILDENNRKYFFTKEIKNLKANQKLYPIKQKYFDKWFTVTIMEHESKFAECNYIVSFTDKGKLN